jgi:hypothetical protein
LFLFEQIKTTRLKKQIKKTSAGERTEVMMSPAAQLFQSLPNVDMNVNPIVLIFFFFQSVWVWVCVCVFYRCC